MSKTDNSDFKLEYAKMFLMNFFEAEFKFQAKITSRSGVCIQGEWQKYTSSSPLLSKDEGLQDIGHSMSIGNLILGVNSVTASYLIRKLSDLQTLLRYLRGIVTPVFKVATGGRGG